MHIHRLDPSDRRDVRRYIDLPFRIYRDSPLWVPPFAQEIQAQLDPERHPFYEHSQAAFFLALEEDEAVGRIAVLDHSRYNQYHDERTAFFYHFESINDREVSRALFSAAFDWARDRGLNRIWGPKGFTAGDGLGLLVRGFDHRPALGIAYNYPYYAELLEDAGFEKKLDLVSCYIHRDMELPPRVLEIAEKVKDRRGFRSVGFSSKAELRAMIPRITAVYNDAFVNVAGYVPITEAEAKVFAERILAVADPALIEVLMKGEEIAGFVLAYPDISAAIQRCKGRIWPFGWFHLMREFKRTRWLNFNGGGILEKYQGLGGNAVLYAEMYRTLRKRSQYEHAELVQVQETNTRMIRELEALGVEPYKSHRLYQRSLA